MNAAPHSLLLTLLYAASVAVASGVSAYVYVQILTQPGHVLEWWSRLIHQAYDKLFTRESEKWYRFKWILKPILECELCVAGQFALWLFLFPVLFKIFSLIFCICLSILVAKILNQVTR